MINRPIEKNRAKTVVG